MDMGSLRQELQLPHHFIMGGSDNDLDEDIMMLGSTPQVYHQPAATPIMAMQKLLTLLCHEMDMTASEYVAEYAFGSSFGQVPGRAQTFPPFTPLPLSMLHASLQLFLYLVLPISFFACAAGINSQGMENGYSSSSQGTSQAPNTPCTHHPAPSSAAAAAGSSPHPTCPAAGHAAPFTATHPNPYYRTDSC